MNKAAAAAAAVPDLFAGLGVDDRRQEAEAEQLAALASCTKAHSISPLGTSVRNLALYAKTVKPVDTYRTQKRRRLCRRRLQAGAAGRIMSRSMSSKVPPTFLPGFMIPAGSKMRLVSANKVIMWGPKSWGR